MTATAPTHVRLGTYLVKFVARHPWWAAGAFVSVTATVGAMVGAAAEFGIQHSKARKHRRHT